MYSLVSWLGAGIRPKGFGRLADRTRPLGRRYGLSIRAFIVEGAK
jgi:hypothetical protein